MKITSVKGTNDYLPNEVEIRDYLQNEILKVYVANGFEHITTPVIEDIENLDKSDGGENLNLIFKIMTVSYTHLTLPTRHLQVE